MALIEHNLDVIKTADRILDLGPKAASRAARSEGASEQVAKEPRSFTGKYLAPLLERGKVRETVAAE